MITGVGYNKSMNIFKRNLPPKTTLENFTNISHLERVLLWFLQNDKQMQIISSEAVHILFDEGIRPKCNEDNNPDVLVKKVNNPQGAKPIERWLILKVWLDLIVTAKVSENTNMSLKESLEKRIDYIEKQTEKTLITTGEIAYKYGLSVSLNLDLKAELSKIKTDKEREDFKYNYLSDSLISSEIRILGWIYKELFNENYQIKK